MFGKYAAFWLLPLVFIASSVSAQMNVVISPRPMPSDTRTRLTGNQTCGNCHEEIFKQWLSTGHAHAYETLKKKNEENNPACLRCHTTGYGTSDGFRNIANTPNFINVQCESCHGPAGNHLASKTGWSRIEAECPDCKIRRTCAGCHTPTHSPDFEFNDYYNRVKH